MKKWYRSTILIWIGSVLFVCSSGLLIVLSDIPFGWLFESTLYTMVGSLLFTLIVLAIRLLSRPAIWCRVTGVFVSLVGTVLLVIVIVCAIDYRLLLFTAPPSELTSEEWAEDLDYLAEQMEQIHPNLFFMVPEAMFTREVAALKERIPTLDRIQMEAEVMRILALPRDAHTYPNIFSLVLDMHLYPINSYVFDDGITITDAGRGLGDLIGTRLVAINGRPTADIYSAMRAYISSENEYGYRVRSALNVAEWLYGAGMTDEPDRAEFTFRRPDGSLLKKELQPVHYLPYFYWTMFRTVEDQWSPAISNDRKRNYWFEWRPEIETIYFQFNRTIIQDNRPIDEFVSEMRQVVGEQDFDRFVIDLRNNDGGDLQIAHPLLDFISQHEKINRRGGLFVLIGRKTFSGGVVFASLLRNNTPAVFIGEPTGQGPNFYAGPSVVTLPNSGIACLVSSGYTQSSVAEDRSRWIAPDLPVHYYYNDFITGRDPAMEAVLAYVPETPPAQIPAAHQIDRMIGRYRYSPIQDLSIYRDQGALVFRIDDHLENSLTRVHSRLYPASESRYTTDIPGVELVFSGTQAALHDQLIVRWKGVEKVIERISEDQRLPTEWIQLGRIDEAIASILENRTEIIEYWQGLEDRLNDLGYEYLRQDDGATAVKIFQLNVNLFPGSANVYDSLGEALYVQGEQELALTLYRRALELNPDFPSAKRMVTKIEAEK
ncbi:tetratricopeptide repeat protein [Candidatus Neomarinimicrobiota bacterium]